MKFLRDLAHDLVEKRLWPVAVVLALALIAIPVVVKSTPAAPGAGSAGAARGAGSDPTAAVTGQEPKRSRLRVRSARDPFAQPFSSRSAAQQGDGTATPPTGGSSGAPSGSAASSGSSGDSSSGSGGGGTSNGSSGSSGGSGSGSAATTRAAADGRRTGAGSSTTAQAGSDRTPTSSAATWTVDVRFGPVGNARKLKAVEPGTVVNAGDEPLLTFVAGRSGGEKARFLLSAGVTPATGGDGVCSPSPDLCRTLTMRAGQTRTLDVATVSGTTQYVLEVGAIRLR